MSSVLIATFPRLGLCDDLGVRVQTVRAVVVILFWLAVIVDIASISISVSTRKPSHG